MILAALLSWFLVGLFIRVSKQRGWGQRIRRDGPQTHLVKEGTPTAGGIGFVAALLLVWLAMYARNPDPKEVVLVLTALAMGVIGLIDDLLKIRSRMQGGGKAELLAREKFPLQVLVSVAFAYFAWRLAPPLPPGLGPWFDISVYVILMLGAVNAFNFTDGLDGLLGGVAIIVLLPLVALQASPLAALTIGVLLGFLWFNAHPARVFMGDMGSHAIGAVAAGAYVLNGAGNFTWFLPLAAVIPVIAVLSVVIQVAYFRRTGGKRIFKMTPIQHHFELSGWPETQVTLRFWIITALMTALVWSLLGGRP